MKLRRRCVRVRFYMYKYTILAVNGMENTVCETDALLWRVATLREQIGPHYKNIAFWVDLLLPWVNLFLPWAICFCRERFPFTVSEFAFDVTEFALAVS